MNCVPGHTSEARAKTVLHGHHPNPLEVASEEYAKQGSDFSDFDGVCVCLCCMVLLCGPYLPRETKQIQLLADVSQNAVNHLEKMAERNSTF